MFLFFFINNFDVELLVFLVKKFFINLFFCFKECLKVIGVCILVVRFFEEEEVGDMGGDFKVNCKR